MRLLCTVVFVLLSFAQVLAKFQPGYIVDLKGDTIRGLIDEGRWARNPRRISFKKNESASGTTYLPQDIRAFHVGDRFFESAIIEIDVSSIIKDKLSDTPVPILQLDTLFLQTLVIGEKDLLYLKDPLEKLHFFIRVSGKLQELTFKQYFTFVMDPLIINDLAKVIAENTAYKQQLISHFGDCPGLQQKIEKAKYEKKAIVELFREYHLCKNIPLMIKG